MRRYFFGWALIFAAVFLLGESAAWAEKVEFEPVRAPSFGAETAPVTVYEIADFM